jgi:hypothetical protein
LRVTIRNRSVPMPEKRRVVETGNPVSTGTRNVAPNMAMTCCAPIAIVAGQFSRSSGLTTVPGSTVRPLPCRVHRGMRAPRSGVVLASP